MDRVIIIAAALLMLATPGCKRHPKEDLSEAGMKARAKQAHDARLAAASAAASAADAKAQAEAAAKAAQHAEETKLLWAQAAEMTPAGREQLVKVRCAAGCSGEEISTIQGAADNDTERRKLGTLADRVLAERAVRQDKEILEARQNFADRYEEALTAKRLIPDSVTATGPERTTLAVVGWFCTEGFVRGFAKGQDGELAKAVRFRKITCEGPRYVYTEDL